MDFVKKLYDKLVGLRTHKGALGDLQAVFISLLVVAFIVAFGYMLLGTLQQQVGTIVGNNTKAYNQTGKVIDVFDLPVNMLPIVVMALIFVIILSLIAVLGGRRK